MLNFITIILGVSLIFYVVFAGADFGAAVFTGGVAAGLDAAEATSEASLSFFSACFFSFFESSNGLTGWVCPKASRQRRHKTDSVKTPAFVFFMI